MWKERLEELIQVELEFGQKLNGGLSEEELRALVRAAGDELQLTLPEEYLQALRVINGFESNGIILYGADEPLLAQAPKQSVNGVIDCNKVWYENEWQKRYLFFGEGSISFYAYDLETKTYVELDNPSGEISGEFDSFEALLEKMLEDALA